MSNKFSRAYILVQHELPFSTAVLNTVLQFHWMAVMDVLGALSFILTYS